MDYKSRMNREILQVKPSGIRKFFDIASEMNNVISLSIGEPDFTTPFHVRAEGIRTLEQGKTFYSPNRGFTALREEIVNWMERKYHVAYHPESEVLVTVGGSEAIDLAIRCLVNPGDEVLIPQPSFVCYVPLTQMAEGIPVIIETKAEDQFRLTAKALREKITPKTKLLVLPFPNNPTGAVMRRKDLEEIAEVVREHDLLVLSDEIYSELTYGDTPHVCFSEIEGMRERTVVVNGFSKAYAMTGWRLGYAAGPREIIKVMIKLHQFAIMCAPTTSQYAAIEAMRSCDDEIERMAIQFGMRRGLMVSSLNRMGLTCADPQGAFYVFPSIRSTGMTSEEFCEALLREQKVAVVPGDAFGKSGEGHVRISYSYSVDHLIEALRRIELFLEARR